uniref:DOC domain-containing protein n=1 Tax=Arcella intermedia TaxID=1963864 RepID=A0A6B2LMD9_9EUKA
MRDDNLDTYWQSDGEQPHYINIQFMKKMMIEEIAIYLSYKLDESYTPQTISIRQGTTFHDLQEIKLVTYEQPEGWVPIKLTQEGKGELHTNFIQICILSNHLSGRDTHIRQIKIYGPTKSLTNTLKIPQFESVDFSMYSTLR